MLLFLQSLTFYLISVIAAIFIGFYLYFTRNFNFWQKLGIPYVKPTPFVGTLKECVLLKTTIGEQLERTYNEHSDKAYVGIFSFDKPSLLIRDLELVKNILVKDFQNFKDRIFTFDDKFDPIFGKNLGALKDDLWYHLRTNLSPAFTSHKIKLMFNLVDTSGKELYECLEQNSADGKLPQDQYWYKMNWNIKLQELKKL
jgi:cytochrome P450 family 6